MASLNFRRLAVLAIIALPACSGGNTAMQVPVAAGQAVASSQRSPANLRAFAANLRAFAADCTSVAALAGSGTCTNVQLAGTAYGPHTPANLVPGLHPSDIQAAYNLPSATSGASQIIGIVVVNDDPNIESDLAVYRSTFALPACTSAGGCLRVMQAGNKASSDADWAREISIDVDMASAACPNCKLLVVEAKSTKEKDLADAVSFAVAQGASVVSNSYAIPESKQEASDIWAHPGIPIVAAAGDTGYPNVSWPAAAPSVVAVGATTLMRDATVPRGWRETAWAGTASGCSTVAAKPAWQTDTGCAMRTVADVAAVGDPGTPVAVYDSYQDAGWVEMGGTSVAAPIVAGVYALAANGATLSGAASLYAHPANLNPVASGSNGICSTTYLCTAGGAYSAPTGVGSPNGLAAF